MDADDVTQRISGILYRVQPRKRRVISGERNIRHRRDIAFPLPGPQRSVTPDMMGQLCGQPLQPRCGWRNAPTYLRRPIRLTINTDVWHRPEQQLPLRTLGLCNQTRLEMNRGRSGDTQSFPSWGFGVECWPVPRNTRKTAQRCGVGRYATARDSRTTRTRYGALQLGYFLSPSRGGPGRGESRVMQFWPAATAQLSSSTIAY